MFGWCWHRWGAWEDLKVTDEWGTRLKQGRRCTKCNKLELRSL